MKTLGTEQFDIYLRRYSIHYETDLEALLTKLVHILSLLLMPALTGSISSYAKLPWTRFITADIQHLATADAMDLLDKLLKYDHRERLTARETQAHVYFSEFPGVPRYLS
jgi:casein kinase II subunit alpha